MFESQACKKSFNQSVSFSTPYVEKYRKKCQYNKTQNILFFRFPVFCVQNFPEDLKEEEKRIYSDINKQEKSEFVKLELVVC